MRGEVQEGCSQSTWTKSLLSIDVDHYSNMPIKFQIEIFF